MSLRVKTGSAVRSAQGFASCGDAAVVVEGVQFQLCAVVDALGHGQEAATSAAFAAELLRRDGSQPLRTIFTTIDQALRGKRAVVLSAVRVDAQGVVFAGVGNVDIHGPGDVSRPTTMRGTLGSGRRFVYREFALAAAPGQRWVLVSDGIMARSINGALEKVRPASRSDDDASALVLDFTEGA